MIAIHRAPLYISILKTRTKQQKNKPREKEIRETAVRKTITHAHKSSGQINKSGSLAIVRYSWPIPARVSVSCNAPRSRPLMPWD